MVERLASSLSSHLASHKAILHITRLCDCAVYAIIALPKRVIDIASVMKFQDLTCWIIPEVSQIITHKFVPKEEGYIKAPTKTGFWVVLYMGNKEIRDRRLEEITRVFARFQSY